MVFLRVLPASSLWPRADQSGNWFDKTMQGDGTSIHLSPYEAVINCCEIGHVLDTVPTVVQQMGDVHFLIL